jgi:hypothetical protein
MVSGGMDVIDPIQFINIYRKHNEDFNADEVNAVTTGRTNEYIFKMYFPLTNYSSCQTSEDAHEYMVGLRKCLLEELQAPAIVRRIKCH